MITLTNVRPVTTVLGSASQTNYDRLDVISIFMDVVNKNISGTCQLLSSGSPQAKPIPGTYSIPTSGSAVLDVEVPSLPFYATIPLTSPQQATVQGWIASTQNLIESGLVSVGVVAGTQAAGL